MTIDSLHTAVCKAVGLLNMSPECAQGAKSREAHNILRQALIDYADRGPWQPMKTAPKDGTAVLLILKGSRHPVPAKWSPRIAKWVVTWDDVVLPDFQARYWMPIPDDPDERKS